MKKLLQCQEKYFYKIIGAMINISIAEERKRNKEAFRKLHQKAGSKEEDVMSRFYEVTSNQCKPVRVDEVTLNRLLKKYGDNGMINIMAYRIDMPQEVNLQKLLHQTRRRCLSLSISGKKQSSIDCILI